MFILLELIQSLEFTMTSMSLGTGLMLGAFVGCHIPTGIQSQF